jgi:hypothetical protein
VLNGLTRQASVTSRTSRGMVRRGTLFGEEISSSGPSAAGHMSGEALKKETQHDAAVRRRVRQLANHIKGTTARFQQRYGPALQGAGIADSRPQHSHGPVNIHA